MVPKDVNNIDHTQIRRSVNDGGTRPLTAVLHTHYCIGHMTLSSERLGFYLYCFTVLLLQYHIVNVFRVHIMTAWVFPYEAYVLSVHCVEEAYIINVIRPNTSENS